MSGSLTVIVLAAGKGTRMKSERPKVLHPLAGRAMIAHVLAAAAELAPDRALVVLAPGMDAVAAEVDRGPLPATVVLQEPQRGTGHAVMAARERLPASGDLLVLYGDTPLITGGDAEPAARRPARADAAVAVLGMRPPDPSGYGRLALDDQGLGAIVEERHADPALRRDGAVQRRHHGHRRRPSRAAARRAGAEAAQERVLSDRHRSEHARRRGWACTAVEGPWIEGVGVNSQTQLAEVEASDPGAASRRAAMASGVTLIAPDTVFLAADTELAEGVEIAPYVVFGPGVRIAAGARILSFSHLVGVRVGPGAEIGPFARLRPGAEIGERAKVGNFVEVKNAILEAGAKANHLSYIGDARVGAKSNIGAGTITCNYDGLAKYRTEIGAGVFIGSNSALVAPVTIGEGAFVGAGSTINRDVPPGQPQHRSGAPDRYPRRRGADSRPPALQTVTLL